MPTSADAERAAERDHQVEARQVRAARACSRTSSPWQNMHARKSPAQNTPIWIASSCVSFGVGERPGHHAERRRQHREEDVAPVPALAVEAEDERQEIDRERHDPQERHRGDVLRDVVRHREQQQRARRGERAPEHLARERRRRLGGASPLRGVARPTRDGRRRAGRAAGSTSRRRRRGRRRARSRPTSPTPARASAPTARAGTDSRRAPASTRDSTARTADTGSRPGRARANHACTSGLVVDSRKYGRPIVAASRPRISHDGFSVPAGFQYAPGMIGSSDERSRRSSAMCSLTCVRGASRRTTRSAYA